MFKGNNISNAKVIESIKLYCKKEDETGVRHVHIYTSKGESTASGWNRESSDIVLEDFKNSNITDVEIIGIDYRSKGGRAFQTVATIIHEDVKYRILFDIRDYNLFDILNYNGCEEGFKLKGNYCFMSDGYGTTLLVPEDENNPMYKKAYENKREAEEYEKKRKSERINKNDLKSGYVYSNIEEEKILILGNHYMLDLNTKNKRNVKKKLVCIKLTNDEIKELKDGLLVNNNIHENKLLINLTKKMYFTESIDLIKEECELLNLSNKESLTYLNDIMSANNKSIDFLDRFINNFLWLNSIDIKNKIIKDKDISFTVLFEYTDNHFKSPNMSMNYYGNIESDKRRYESIKTDIIKFYFNTKFYASKKDSLDSIDVELLDIAKYLDDIIEFNKKNIYVGTLLRKYNRIDTLLYIKTNKKSIEESMKVGIDRRVENISNLYTLEEFKNL